MTFDLGAIIAHVKADITDFQSKMGSIKNGVEETKGRFAGLGDAVKGFAQGVSLITAAAGTGLAFFLKSSSDAASDFTKNMITLDIIAERFGQSGKKAQESAKQLGDELRIGVSASANGLQNLLKSGLNLDQASDLMRRFTNEAMTGKSSSISLGQAVENLSFAFATGNSALGNMSGISENWSDITEKGATILGGWNGKANASIGITEELAAQIKAYEGELKAQGKTLDASNDEQSKYIGLLALTNLTMGSAARFQGTYIDNLAQTELKMNKLKQATGDLVNNALNPLVMWFNSSGIMDGLTRFATVLDNIIQNLVAFATGASYARIELAEALTFFTGGDWEAANGIAIFLEGIVGAFKALGDWVAAHQEIVMAFLTGLAIAFGALLLIAPLILIAMNPFILLFAAIEIAVGLLFVAWQTNFLGIQQIVGAVVTAIAWIFNNILIPAFTTVINWIKNVFVPTFITFFNAVLKPEIEKWTKWFMDNWDNIKIFLEGIWKIISGIIMLGWNIVSSTLIMGMQLLSGDWKGAWETVKSATAASWEAIKRIFFGIVDVIRAWGGDVLAALVKPFVDAWNQIKEIVANIKSALDFTKRHSPSVVDIVERGVYKVNQAFDELSMGAMTTPSPTFAALNAMPSINQGASAQMPQVIVDMTGALISDEAAAERMGEIVGDGIIRKLQSNVRF